MCQSADTNWIKFITLLIVIIIKLTLANNQSNNISVYNDQLNNQTNDSILLTVHPWLPIGNFTGIIINDNSVNQSYYSYNYIYNLTSPPLNQQQQSDDKVSDDQIVALADNFNNDNVIESDQMATIYQRIGVNNYSDNDKVNSVNVGTNPDESSLSFLDDSPTKEEDYAGGGYGNDDDDLTGSEGGNFAQSQEDEGLT